jgi:hypothetical protein
MYSKKTSRKRIIYLGVASKSPASTGLGFTNIGLG